jgi:hypothetical protein
MRQDERTSIHRIMYGTRFITSIALGVAIAGCSTGGGGPYQPASGPTPSSSTAPVGWPVRSAEYVDVWLHSFSLVTPDTARVPLFERGYRDRMLALRRQRNVVTALDANQATLAAGLSRNPELLNAQFAIFGFASFAELVRVTPQFIANDGSPATVTDPTTQQLFVWLRQYFPTVADREWLRVFVTAVQEEQTKFYESYWNATTADRAAVRQQVGSLWTGTYRQKFARFMRNAQLADGTMILSLPLGGEGRTVTDRAMGNGIAVPFPATTDSALNAIYVFAHEATGTLTQQALADNTTPADQRSGVVARMQPIANVRAGAILLQRIAPELVAGYERFYLAAIGTASTTGDPAAAFASAFQIPDGQLTGITRQIDLILAGI